MRRQPENIFVDEQSQERIRAEQSALGEFAEDQEDVFNIQATPLPAPVINQYSRAEAQQQPLAEGSRAVGDGGVSELDDKRRRQRKQVEQLLDVMTYQQQPKLAKPDVKINAKRLLVVSFLLLFLENCLNLVFQMVSYYFLESFWKSTTYVFGVVMLLVYVPLAGIMVVFVGGKVKLFLIGIKAVEFAVYFFLIAFAVAYLDISLLALSYMLLFAVLTLLVFIWLTDQVGLMCMILVLFGIFLDAIWKSLYLSHWYAALPVAIFLVFSIFAMAYETKQIICYSLVKNPSGYLDLTLSFTLRLWFMLQINALRNTNGEEEEEETEG